MAKFLLLILSLSFVLQTSGATQVFKKHKQSIEQCTDGNQTGEESGKSTFQNEEEQMNQCYYPGIATNAALPIATEMMDYHPIGFYSKPFMPPK